MSYSYNSSINASQKTLDFDTDGTNIFTVDDNGVSVSNIIKKYDMSMGFVAQYNGPTDQYGVWGISAIHASRAGDRLVRPKPRTATLYQNNGKQWGYF